MSAALIVTCARCLADYREDDPAVRYASGDWFCHDEAACDDRMAVRTCGCGHTHLPGAAMCHVCDLPLAPRPRCPDCNCDPTDPGSLGGHGAGECTNPDCPAGCYEEDDDGQ